MDVILDTASDPVWVGVIFIILLLVLHFLLVVWHPLTAKQWKLAEYVWVGLAVLSTLGLVDEARRYKAELNAETLLEALERDQRRIDNWFNVYKVFACEEQAEEQRYKKLCNWITLKSNDLELILGDTDNLAPDIRLNILDGIEVPGIELSPAEKQIVENHVLHYGRTKAAYVDSVNISSASRVQRLLITLAPIFFAMALALKMTKVTGEYRCYD
jgi:preprotein translocase subunit SecG